MEVCIFWLEKRSEVLGGPNVVVEIDEAKIGHRKYNRGLMKFGFLAILNVELVKSFLVPVPTRDLATLLSVIKKLDLATHNDNVSLLVCIGESGPRRDGAQDEMMRFSCSCLLYTSPSPRDRTRSRMPSSA